MITGGIEVTLIHLILKEKFADHLELAANHTVMNIISKFFLRIRF